ncbi:MAG: hypothetical protein M1833_005979 [Piccolia ochrophora]|nr:MAG: hypothetical protein M1833_005979 [Piccolia ochrophora]
MPKLPEEDALLTLFADVHYYFSPPTVKPPHHRFDKSSYVYLYKNVTLNRARVEVANNPGTPDQDAFAGFLDSAMLQYSHKHPTLCSLTCDGAPQNMSALPPPRQAEGQQWHLPTLDLRNEGKYLFKIHTVDIYFWTKEDATHFLNSARRVLPPTNLRILDAPVAPPPHKDAMSPVVQKLEQVAISTPPGHRLSSAAGSTTAGFAPPPANDMQRRESTQSQQPEKPAGFAPMAYNPAAPAAPEPIQHREKTPPPPDAGAGTGLVAAAANDAGHQFAPPPTQHQNSYQSPPLNQAQSGYFGAPVQRQQSFPPPPPSAGSFHGSQTSPAPGTPFSPPIHRPGSYAQQQPGTGAPAPGQQYGQPMASPPPSHPQSPANAYGYASPPPQQQQQHSQPQQYGNYSPSQGYTSPPPPPGSGYPNPAHQQQQQQQYPTDPYAIHQQAYRPPTEAENNHHNHKPATGQQQQTSSTGSRLPAQAANVQKGVGKFLRKLEKKVG